MDLKKIEEIKKIAIKAMFSDDFLMDRLVLKGGNALDLIYGIAQRSSIDLDFSIKGDFKEAELDSIKGKIEATLNDEFDSNGYNVFDIKFKSKPAKISEDMKLFWGGYEILFKVIGKSVNLKRGNDIGNLRRNAEVIGPQNQRVFSIDISKFEYCDDKKEKELDGLRIYIYTPEMIVMEKLRALCQQTEPYRKKVKSRQPIARAKDFFDIYTAIETCKIDISERQNIELLRKIFEAKKVDLSLLDDIEKYRELHRDGFNSLRDVVKDIRNLKEFDFYFDYVLDICKKLKSLGII